MKGCLQRSACLGPTLPLCPSHHHTILSPWSSRLKATRGPHLARPHCPGSQGMGYEHLDRAGDKAPGAEPVGPFGKGTGASGPVGVQAGIEDRYPSLTPTLPGSPLRPRSPGRPWGHGDRLLARFWAWGCRGYLGM